MVEKAEEWNILKKMVPNSFLNLTTRNLGFILTKSEFCFKIARLPFRN